MARLTRKNIKVFAGNATNNGVFGSLQAENPVTTNNVEQIQSLPAWGNGWNSATVTSDMLPPLEEFQGVQYVITYQQAYLMQEGLPEWAASVTYYKGSLVKEVTANGFKIYNSLTDDNTNNLLSDTSNWVKVMDSTDLYAFDNEVVHIAGAETITGQKTFSNTISGSISGNAATVTNGVYTTGNQTIGGTKTFSSATYGTASDVNNSILTTVAKSKASDGYFRLGNGLIIQWGRVNLSSNAHSATLTFPTSFTSTNYAISANTSENKDLGNQVVAEFFNKNTSFCRYNSSYSFNWIAIGY